MSITCLTCPSFLQKDEASEFFGVSAAGAMCARYGWIFGYDDKVAEAAVEKYSEHCSSRGNARPDKEIPSTNFGATYTPRPDLLVATGEKVSSCLNCVNFDQSQHACAAQGRMIFTARFEQEADGCLWAKDDQTSVLKHETVGPILTHLTGNTIEVPVFIKANTAATSTVTPANKPPTKRRGLLQWPRDYDTDAPVQEELKDMIRAYRKVDTRQGPIYLPIFQTDYFGDRADLIPDPNASGTADPSLYIDHSGLLEKFAVASYKLDQNLLLTGEPGTGKSEGAAWLAWMMNMPFVRLAYNESSEPDQFLGSPGYGDTGEVDPVTGQAILGTYFKPGILPTNWQEPCILLSDEVNLPTEAIQQAYRSGNDSSRILQVYGHTYRRHDYCFHLAALNPAHDFRNIGAKPMASADSSRYVFHNMPNPSPEMIRKVLTATVERLDHEVPDPHLITTIINIGEDLRALSREGKLPDFWTLRQEVKVVRMAPFFGLKGAYACAYLDYVDQNTRELCETAIRSHTPSGPEWAN